jgi:hypothetical protein
MSLSDQLDLFGELPGVQPAAATPKRGDAPAIGTTRAYHGKQPCTWCLDQQRNAIDNGAVVPSRRHARHVIVTDAGERLACGEHRASALVQLRQKETTNR